MAATAKGCAFRPTKRAGRKTRFYWVKYRDAQGNEKRHVLKLLNGDGVTDKSVAEHLLREILNRVEREAAGLIDRTVEAATLPIRIPLASFVRHLRRKRRSRSYIKQAATFIKRVFDMVGIVKVGEFNEDRIDRALGSLSDSGLSPRTVNAHREVLHAFGEWCLKFGRCIGRNPVAAISKRDQAADIRKVRRALTIAEVRRLLAFSGPRRLFYAVQLWTGLRVSEVRALQWGDLELGGPRPHIRLRAATTKSKRADELPIYPDLVPELERVRPHRSRPKDTVFGSTPTLRTFHADLTRASIKITDDRDRTVDRHTLRTTFITWLGQYGVDPRAQIALARHSPQGVTLRNYQDFTCLDLSAEIRKLPGIWSEPPQILAATGTCDSGSVVPQVVPTEGISQLRLTSNGSDAETAKNGQLNASRSSDTSNYN